MGIKWEDRYHHYGGMREDTLFDIARNESAMPDHRKVAVEIMILNGFQKANHPEVLAIKQQILAERAADPIPEPILHETELSPLGVIKPLVIPSNGALTASVTTKTMFEDVQNTDFKPADEAPILETPFSNTKEIQ